MTFYSKLKSCSVDKVLNSVECLQDYVIETDIWISTLLSIGCNQEGDINRFFSNALFKLLNDPYKLQQNLKSVLKIEYGELLKSIFGFPIYFHVIYSILLTIIKFFY